MKGCSLINSDGLINLNYMDIPLLFNIGQRRLQFQIGIQPSILLSAKSKTGSGSSVDIKSITNSFDMSPIVGLTYNLNQRLNLAFRLSYGITNIIKDNPVDPQHNFNTQLTVGYSFGR